ncbi:3' terminal RNA ribose 2'-O-methyltransferase Hen1 [Actinacidiphila yeochonensis]|uniref:3' terminal RNA ribose 2'-O-methyltransferase Hen1 n=1 Tax=Actinacidiphila yeochonensis TaxID=89050 RepID=UPI00099DCF53|nr:3' terminal RNA ribose 2'-O-methyltransferase Hen1 [Actinacidiphila yeochonensis]
MFLTITLTGKAEAPATDLGFLLHKHPDKAQVFSTAYGTAHVLYPEATVERTTAALLLEVDPPALARRGKGGGGRGGSADTALAQYVNDRPYAASSLMAVALRTVFATALRGECRTRPERAAAALPLRIEVPVLPAKGGAALVARLFEPLGWRVAAEPVELDPVFPEWGASRYVRLVLEGEVRLAHALRHLYVLLPVLDDAKHYWVSADEVDKLLRFGEGWLPNHPEQRLITGRYLARRWSLTRQAAQRLELARLADRDDVAAEDLDNAVAEEVPEEVEERPTPLAVRRREAILDALRSAGAARVLDLGCGEGHLMAALLKEARFTRVVGSDVSMRALGIAARRLRLDRMGERQAERVALFQGSLTYRDDRLAGYDAAVLSEVVEHVDPPRLPALEYAVFGAARPGTVVVTTPNAEYNVRWETLPAGHVRHADHRFEWRRAEFADWAEGVAGRNGYAVRFVPVGDEDPEVGAPTQMAVFTRTDGAAIPTDRAAGNAGRTEAVPQAPEPSAAGVRAVGEQSAEERRPAEEPYRGEQPAADTQPAQPAQNVQGTQNAQGAHDVQGTEQEKEVHV